MKQQGDKKPANNEVATSTGLVVGAETGMQQNLDDKKRRADQLQKLKKLGLIIIALVVLIFIGLAWRSSHQKGKQDEVQAFNAMIKLEQVAHNSGKDDVAKKLLTEFMTKYPHVSKEQAYVIDSSFVAIYRTANDYKLAEQWQLKAMENSPKVTFTDYYNLAEVCYYNKDKACATKYYQKALDELNNKARINGIDGYKYYINSRLKALK